MSNPIDRAKVFCKISFAAPSEFPTVTSFDAAEKFSFLTDCNLAETDFNKILHELFGETIRSPDPNIFYLARTNFFKKLTELQKNLDIGEFYDLTQIFETACEGG